MIEESKTPGVAKAIYKLEEMPSMENTLMETLEIKDLHNNRPKFNGVGVYNQYSLKTLINTGFFRGWIIFYNKLTLERDEVLAKI